MSTKNDLKAFYLALAGTNFNEFQALVLNGLVDVNVLGEGCEQSLLQFAAGSGHLKFCELLLERGANVTHSDFKGETALHWASVYGYVDIVRLLLSAAADDKEFVNRVNNFGLGSVHFASLHGHCNVLAELCAANANVHVMCTKNQWPIFMAAEMGQRDAVKFLATMRRNGNDALQFYATKLADVDNRQLVDMQCNVLARLLDQYRRCAPLMLLCFDAIDRLSALPRIVVEHCHRRRLELLNRLHLSNDDLALLGRHHRHHRQR